MRLTKIKTLHLTCRKYNFRYLLNLFKTVTLFSKSADIIYLEQSKRLRMHLWNEPLTSCSWIVRWNYCRTPAINGKEKNHPGIPRKRSADIYQDWKFIRRKENMESHNILPQSEPRNPLCFLKNRQGRFWWNRFERAISLLLKVVFQ